MLTNAALFKKVLKKENRLFVRVNILCVLAKDYMTENEYPEIIGTNRNCHVISRAISRLIPELKLVDGWCHGIHPTTRNKKPYWEMTTCCHSWLETSHGNIIDTYPVGAINIGALLVITKGKYKSFGGGLYKKEDTLSCNHDLDKIEKDAEILTRVLHDIEEKHSPKKKT